MVLIRFLFLLTAITDLRADLSNAIDRLKRQTFQINGNGQEDTDSNSPGCIVHCLTVMAKGALTNGYGSSQNPIESGSSLVCTKYDQHGIDEVCKSYAEGLKCFETCADSPVKNITLNGFSSVHFVCVERRKDFDKALPCIGDSCAAAEQLCKPVCGLIQNGTKERLVGSLDKLANANSGSDFMNLDLFGIRKTIADNCRYATCYMNCSRASLTAKCGEQAYVLYEELIWRLISAATHSFADLGLGNIWPDECKAFTAFYDVQHATTSTVSTLKIMATNGVTVLSTPNPETKLVAQSCKNSTCGQGSNAGTKKTSWTAITIFGFVLLLLIS